MWAVSLVVSMEPTLPTSATLATVRPESVSAAPSPNTRIPVRISTDIVVPATATTSAVSRKSVQTARIPGWS